MNPFSNTYNSDASDRELFKRIKEGDKNSLNTLISRHQPFIYNIAWKMTGDSVTAEDLSQEALLKIISNLGSFKHKSSFRTWAYRIVRNHFLNDTKKPSPLFSTKFEELGDRLDAIENIQLSIEDQMAKAEEIREVRLQCLSGMLLCLTKEQRIIYIIGEVFGADHNIGSEIMDISKANYRMKLSKSRKDLQNFMLNKCGLVNKANPCRCHKKVTIAIETKMINAKNLLFNKKKFSTFKEALEEDANTLVNKSDQIYVELHRDNSFKTDFDKKNFIAMLLESKDWRARLHLN
ncbi:MAG: sigma-70 family RNA polymerase sigma factor [Crocinitomicaceae bacterium]|jgi:RNA polymerase sigma factor (sigma-70 family)|tara:strand:- start:2163 stop:3038 length:876 start_codon:yes stop_codon:yes gene_type:complete